jgi:DNA-binding SARP family transcriptional activator
MDFGILGPLEIRQDGTPLACRGTKQRLLLATLLLQPNEVVSSDRLIEALWGERPPATAQKALHVHVSQLRRVLAAGPDGERIVTRPPGYELRVADGDLDLQRFETTVAAARAASARGQVEQASALLHDALDLWRGTPLADLTFEQFLQPEIARLEELRLAALEDRVDADLALGRHLEMIGELEGLAAEHPLRERIQGQLMVALYRSGRQAEALEVYRDTRRRLVDELGLEPGRELKALEAAILGQDAALEAPSPTAGEDPGDADALIGRDRELAELSELLSASLAGRGSVVLIAGEPGIGKSRLAETVARQAQRQGARVAVGRCWEAGGAPAFWPWIQALRTIVGEADARALSELLDDPAATRQESDGARFRMFGSIAALLREACAATPVALFLDDIHAADASSLLLLRFIAAELTDIAILVVASYRDTEVDAQLDETLAELSRAGAVHRLALRGLDAAATSQLLAATMAEPPPEALAARVHAETRGNPLFAGELGRLFAAEGGPVGEAERLPIPDGVREAIRRRLRRQSGDCQEALTLASVLGREFEPTVLAAVSDSPEAKVSAAVDEASAARLVGPVPGTAERLRFSHILVRDALYGDLPVLTRQRLHLNVAAALESPHLGGPAASVSELAHHYLAAGSDGCLKAIDYAQRAADDARSQHAYEEAARWYSTTLDLLERTGTSDGAQRCDLLLALGESLSRAGNGPEAKDALRQAAAIAEAEGWPDRLATAALAYSGRFAWARASTDPVLVPLVERALAAVGRGADTTRARLLARLAAATRDDPVRDRRVALADEAVELARRSGDLPTLAYALEGSWVAREAQDPRDGIAVGDELIALGGKLGDRERVFLGHDFRMHALWSSADRAGIDVEIAALDTLAGELRQPAHEWHARSHRTMVALMEGRFGEAEPLISETRLVGQRAEGWNAAVSERLQLFVLRHAQGRLSELEPSLARSVHEFPALLRFRCALAHASAAIGNERAARAALDDVLARDPEHHYLDAEWLFTICLLPDVCRVFGDTEAAATVYGLLLPYAGLYAEAPVEASFGAVARGLGVAATVLGDVDSAEHHLEAAIEMERRMRARPWVAHAQHDLAATLLARAGEGDRARAGSLLDEAVREYQALGMQSWAESALRLGR